MRKGENLSSFVKKGPANAGPREILPIASTLEGERVGPHELSRRFETGPSGSAVWLEAMELYVGVAPILDVADVDLRAPVDVADLLAVAEGQVDCCVVCN